MSGYGFTAAGTSYDDEDRLTGYARTSGTFTQAWNLTPVGDWNSITTNGTAQNRTHGPTHELLTAGGQSLATDPKGNITLLPLNLTPQSSPLALQWDFDNKLKGADLGNNSSVDVNFQYDALGRRVARTGTGGSFVFVQHDQQTIADYGYGDAPSSPLYRYVYASYIDEPVVRKAAGTGGTIHYYHRNQQYSITAMTTSTGAVAERYAYTASGQPTILSASGTVLTSSAVGNRYTYTGREWDETLGLHHFRARWMSPLAGRFVSRDPIHEFREELTPLFDEPWLSKILANLNEFSESSPINYVDERGLYPHPPVGCTNAVTTTGTGSGRMKCYEYYPDNLASNGLQKKCLCRSTIQDPEYPNVGMGCTRLPYTIFTPACDDHDTCWGTCGADQATCDRDFLRAMNRICEDRYPNNLLANMTCRSQARAMWHIVRWLTGHFQNTQDDACLWNDCPPLATRKTLISRKTS